MDKNKFAVTPPMGWNSYDYYDTTVTEEEVKANARYMAENMKAYGWEYVVIDIEWYANDAGTRRQEYQYIPFGDDEMDAYGRFQPSPNRFPSSAGGKGFAPLAEYIHSLGLKIGIHIMRGIPREAAHRHCPIAGTSMTADMAADPSSICGWNPDMYGVRANEAGQAYYDSIISMYADWGIDFIKCDDICDSWLYRDIPFMPFSGWEETKMIYRAIEKTGRNIVLSLSPGPAHIDRAWEYRKYANMWRITDDFWDHWDAIEDMFGRCELWQDHVSEGCFPDCDMLPVGKLGKGFGEERDTYFTREEQKTMLTLWCMFRSPLMIGAELTKLDDWTKQLLTNQDILGLEGEHCKGEQVFRDKERVVWKSVNEATKEVTVALFNLKDEEREIFIAAEELSVDTDLSNAVLYELWDKEEYRIQDDCIKATVPPHGVKVYRIRK
mgnify:CR=1 FL=1